MSIGKLKITLLVIVVHIFTVSLNAVVTRSDAENLVLNQILADEIGSIDIYISNDIIYSQNILQLWNDESISPSYDSNWVFFVDNMPFANWYHPCRYIFVNTETSEYQIVNENIYPENYENDFELIAGMPRPEPINLQTNPNATIESREPDEHLYAVIINGADQDRYWNDISAIYCTLIDVYGYTKENIIVHYVYGPGTSVFGDDLDGPDEPSVDIDFDAYKTTIQATFQDMENTLGPDDQLFVFVDDHGNGDSNGHSWVCLPGDDLHDYELAEFVENINCAQMIFVMEPCFSGGFVDDLTDYVTYNVQCENRVVHTACDYDELSVAECHITNLAYDEFVFYWTAAARGYYPGDHPWELGDALGEFPFENYPTLINHPQDYDPLDSVYGGNGDDFAQMGEIFDYADNWDTWSQYGYFCQFPPYTYVETPQNASTISFQEDLLSLSGLCGYVENSQTISGNFMINPALTIETGISLTLLDDSNIYCLGVFSLENNVSLLFGDNSTVEIDESAALNIDSNVSFTGYNIGDCGTLAINSTGQTNFDDTHFEYCNLISTNGSLSISDSDFLGCYISSEDGELHISNTEFDDENWSYHTYGIVSNNDSEIELDNVLVENFYQGIRLNYPVSFKINNSISQNNHSHNFFVVNSRGINNEIYNSQFTGSSVGHGLNIYGSSLTATSCYIANNGTGILLMNRSNVTVRKDPNSNPWYLDSVILDNSWAEITFYDDCRLHLADNRNKIIDNSYTPGTSDEFLINCPNLMTERDFSYNYWGYTDMYNNAILPPDNRFNPEGAYNLSPVYDPGIPREDDKPDDQIMYETAVLEAENGNTVQAEIMLKDLIAQYPNSDYKRSSASYLLSIQDNNFQSLKTYFINEPNLHSNDLIELYTAYLQTYCDIQSENYQEAIDWFESIITNPPSLVDSVYAVIDLGDLYLQMGGNGRGAVGRYPELIPQSRVEFEETREDLFALLSEEYNFENEPEEEPSNNSLPTCVTLNGNYPNPFNPETTISFSIPDESKIELSVFNIKGQKIRTLVNNKLERGNHSIVWDGKSESGKTVSSGVFFYRLSVNGKSNSVKKCLMLK